MDGQLEDGVVVKVRHVQDGSSQVKRQATWRVKITRLDKHTEELSSGVEEIDPMIPGVSNGNPAPIRRDGYSPRVVKSFSARRSSHFLGPKAAKESFTSVEDLHPVVVLVRDEEPVGSCVIGDGSWAEKLAMAAPTTSKGKVQGPIRIEDVDPVLLTVRHPELLRPCVAGESPGFDRMVDAVVPGNDSTAERKIGVIPGDEEREWTALDLLQAAKDADGVEARDERTERDHSLATIKGKRRADRRWSNDGDSQVP